MIKLYRSLIVVLLALVLLVNICSFTRSRTVACCEHDTISSTLDINKQDESIDTIILETTQESIETETEDQEIYKEVKIHPVSRYEISVKERDMLASLAFLEAGCCSIDTQIAVISVVFNRLYSGMWTKDIDGNNKITLFDIVYYPNAFSVADKISKTSGNESTYQAVDYVLNNGSVFPSKVCFFRASYDFKWPNYKHYCIMDNLYFGYLSN